MYQTTDFSFCRAKQVWALEGKVWHVIQTITSISKCNFLVDEDDYVSIQSENNSLWLKKDE